MTGKHLKNGAKKNNLKVVLNLVIVAAVLVMLICSISAFAKFVIKQDNEISLFFRKVVLEIEVDYSEMLSDEHLIASISTEEKLNIQYKIDDGEWQDYSEQLYIVEDCTIYARLTDGTTVYKETEQEILMPVACTKIGDAETYHTTVQNAINIAGTNEATVILLKDNIIDTLTIAEGQNITLDLNNHTLKSTNGSIVASYGDFTVTGEGTLAGEVYLDYSMDPEIGAPMVVLSTAGAAIKNLGDGTVKILSGTVKTFGKYVIAGQGTIIIGNEDDEVGAGPDVNGIIEVSADVYVHSGQITSKETGISSDKNITITGGTITGGKYGVSTTSGTLTIGNNDDTVSTTAPSITGPVGGIKVGDNATLDFYDGIITGPTDNSIEGNVTNTPNGYNVQKTNDGTNQTAILVSSNYVEYNGDTIINYYSTLQEAFTGAVSGNTIKPLKDLTDESTADIELAEGKNVILDLNGFKILTAQRIENTGTLEIKDSVGNGIYQSNTVIPIHNINSGSFTLTSGTIKKTTSTNAQAVVHNVGNSVFTMNGGKIESDVHGIVNADTAEIVINAGTINAQLNAIRDNSIAGVDENNPSIVINGGTITAPGTAIYNEELGTINISGGTINAGLYGVLNYKTGTINVTDGNITGAWGVRNNNEAGTINVSGGTITATEKAAIGTYKGTAVITGGNIIGATYGVYTTAGTTITGGTITAVGGYLDSGEEAGIGAYIGKGLIVEGGEDIIAGTLTIGSWAEGDADSPSTTVPSIEGSIEGVRRESGTFNFYDGVLIGLENKAIIGGVTQTPASYTVKKVNDGTKQTATLVYAVATTTIGNTTTSYTTIQAAIDAAGTSEATVDLLYSGSRSEILTIEAGQNITLNMNGATITSAKNTITNRGNLTITGDGKIEGTGTAYTMILLREGAELTVENGTLDAAYRAIQVYANATLNIGEDDATVNETVPLIIGKSSYGIYMSSETTSIINFYDGIVKGAAGQSISGPIARTPDGYDVTKGSETIENVEYETAYLISIDAVAKTEINKSVSYYETVQEAINAAGTNEGARVTLLSNNISEGVTVAENQNIILNLNGKKLTYAKASTINNLGTLRIIGDGIVEGTGATLIHTITNDGTLIKDGKGELKATNTGNNYVVDNNATGTFIMNDGTITSNDRGLYNSTATGANGCIVINGGTINAVDYGIYNDSAATDENSPAVKITAGEITSSTEVGIYAVKAGRIEIGNATIVGNTYGIHSESTGTIIIDGANITGENNWGIYNEASGKITIYDGYIVGNGHGVGASTGSKGELNVYGGTLKGLVSDGLVTGACTVTIGIDDGNVSQTTPHIEGYRYGLNKNSTSAKVYYNDGIIISNSSSAITGTITGTATGYVVNTVTNETGGKTATLIANYGEYDAQGNFVNAYSTLATATAGVTSGNTIKVLRTLSETTAPSVPAGTTVKLDMNDQTTTLTGVTLTNNGTLQIIGDGEIINTKSNTIKNNGTLNIEEGVKITGVTTYVSGSTGAESTIDNYGNLTVNGGTIIAKSADAIFNESTGIVTINSGTIEGNKAILRNFGTASTEENPSVKILGGTLTAKTANGITNKSSGLLYIGGGTISSKQTASYPTIYNETGKIKIAGGTIISENDRAVANFYEGGYAEITGGHIIGYYGVQNKGTLLITGGVIEGTDSSAVINNATVTLGKDDGTISTTSPRLIGSTHGLNNTSVFYYYDGLLQGVKGTAINGTVTGKPTGYNVVTTTITEDDVVYNTSYLSNT